MIASKGMHGEDYASSRPFVLSGCQEPSASETGAKNGAAARAGHRASRRNRYTAPVPAPAARRSGAEFDEIEDAVLRLSERFLGQSNCAVSRTACWHGQCSRLRSCSTPSGCAMRQSPTCAAGSTGKAKNADRPSIASRGPGADHRATTDQRSTLPTASVAREPTPRRSWWPWRRG